MRDAPLIAVSMGDPRGVGPEVIVKSLALASVRDAARWAIFGDQAALERAAEASWTRRLWDGVLWKPSGRGAAPPGRVAVLPVDGLPASGSDEARAGAASFAAVERAIELAKLPPSDPWHASAVVTGPISKAAWHAAGRRYPGHTELFAEQFGARRHAMMFHAPPGETGPGMNVILATTHVPLGDVPGALSRERIEEVIALGAETLRSMGVASPRVGVCGLNPHAGEGGLLGAEDDAVIAPAVAHARESGIDATGPHPADTIFQRALIPPSGVAERFDLVVAMYHDQGLIPLKTLAWDRAVNMTVGLSWNGRPVVRTSPDHGTALDIAGQGRANPGSMRAAMRLAATLAAERARRDQTTS
ncbi:MAG TPA: 4-hydroxythreonine-4-phosphate dehydrogenase PdxA [Phycisphaerales bacterium]|nr:4-hydroxythreonine-4-phosphate dehydrogenase PdxA [Phycisphaerales bacterium]